MRISEPLPALRTVRAWNSAAAAVKSSASASLLPADLASRRYAGSLTTPPCSEGVRWVVLTDRIEISAELFEAIHQRLHGNARPVQDRNDRPIQADEADR